MEGGELLEGSEVADTERKIGVRHAVLHTL